MSAHPVLVLAKRGLRALATTAGLGARRAYAATGLPLRRHYRLLRCARGENASGLFSEFGAVLGALDHYERWKPLYAGIEVSFGAEGLYHEPAHGDNWWTYYFEPVALGDRAAGPAVDIPDAEHDRFAGRLLSLPRARGFQLIERYVRPRPQLGRAVDAFAREQFADAQVVGVHYRGTDKREEAPRIAYEAVLGEVAAALRRAGDRRSVVFVATDEQRFLDFMHDALPGRIRFRDIYRSPDERSVHHREGGNHRKGEDAVIDCLLLARADILVRTPSNLGLSAALFNPRMPVVSLGRDA